MQPRLGRLVLYTSCISKMIDFYSRFFGYRMRQIPGDRIVELLPDSGGAAILLHPAAKGQKKGQSLVKLVFDVEDVPAFCLAAKAGGLCFGTIHDAQGYCFANAKDPSGNSVSVSSRAFATL